VGGGSRQGRAVSLRFGVCGFCFASRSVCLFACFAYWGSRSPFLLSLLGSLASRSAVGVLPCPVSMLAPERLPGSGGEDGKPVQFAPANAGAPSDSDLVQASPCAGGFVQVKAGLVCDVPKGTRSCRTNSLDGKQCRDVLLPLIASAVGANNKKRSPVSEAV
jgi:hypothetical protein